MPRQVLAFDVLHGEPPDDRLVRGQRAPIGAPRASVIAGHAKGCQPRLAGQTHVVGTVTCSDLISSGVLLDYILGLRLELCEKSGAILLTLQENRLGLSNGSLITSESACIQ